MEKPRWPWGSKKSVNRAGETLRSGLPLAPDVVECLESWRRGHRNVLNTFQAILRTKTKGTDITVAQRLKRRLTISDKLMREPGMQLVRMDDVAGCRLIFKGVEDLREFRNRFHGSRFKHKRKNDDDKYDYIKKPKKLGYRGIHDIYEYDASSKKAAPYKGLLLELQYRTRNQHAWATCVEFVSRVTKHQPKFNRGDAKHIEFFKLASEIIARTTEESKSCYCHLSNREVLDKLVEIDNSIELMKFLRGVKPSYKNTQKITVILRVTKDNKLIIYNINDNEVPTKRYFELEKKFPEDDIVLVGADKSSDIRKSYNNYFSDVGEFVKLIDDGVKALG